MVPLKRLALERKVMAWWARVYEQRMWVVQERDADGVASGRSVMRVEPDLERKAKKRWARRED